jgi:3',5'-cyclic AMP phosphodiesterase CpdA
MSRILHISDLHFGCEVPRLVDALERQIHRLAPELVVASGDLTQRARRHELEAAAAFIERLPSPVLAVPGNHDLPGVTPKRFLDPWRRWHAYFPAGLEPSIETPELLALGTNSARPCGAHLDWSRGRLNRAQIERLADRLRDEPSSGEDDHRPRRLRLLAAHHPLLLTAAGQHRGLLGRSALVLATLSAAGLDLALGGHVHRGYAGTVSGIVVAQAGTAVSDRLVGEANGFNLIDGGPTRLRVTRWAWSADDFVPSGESRFRRSGQGWETAP